jgi:hypothetical protein
VWGPDEATEEVGLADVTGAALPDQHSDPVEAAGDS